MDYDRTNMRLKTNMWEVKHPAEYLLSEDTEVVWEGI